MFFNAYVDRSKLVEIFASFGVDNILQTKPRWESVVIDNVRSNTANSLSELAEMARAIDCDLKKYATNLVFGEGPEHADIMIVGEAPGAEEDLQGRPFVGQSGQLLIKALGFIGINREEVYITNTIPWRPIMNRTPTQSEIDLFLPIKKQQISMINPKIILCVGSISAKTITGNNSGIMKIRGKWFKYGSDTLVMATFHPAFLLRSPTQKKFFWQDLVKLKIKYSEVCGR